MAFNSAFKLLNPSFIEIQLYQCFYLFLNVSRHEIFRFLLGICRNFLTDLFSLQILLEIYFTYRKNLENTALRYTVFDLNTLRTGDPDLRF